MKFGNWKHWFLGVTCGIAIPGFSGLTAHAEDLRDAAPADAYLAIYAMANPERDYQKQHFEAVLKEINDTKIVEKVLQLVQSNMGEGDAEQFLAVRDAFRAALAPVEWDKLMKISETLVVQKTEGPTTLSVMMFRIPDGGAESLKTGIVNLFGLAAGASQGNVAVGSQTVAGVDMTVLELPKQMPFVLQPAVGVKGDLILLTTSLAFAQESLELLGNPSATSKFDDPRVVDALSHLPKAEDTIVVFDGKLMSEQLQSIPTFIETASGGNPEAARVAGMLSEVFNQTAAFDIEVTVEYTEGFQNRSSSFGRMSKSANETVLGQMFAGQKSFDKWSTLVPASATGFSLTSGANALPLYNWIVEEIPAAFPESQQGFDKFAAIQDQFDLHLKEDLLESFSGETVSVTMPGAPTPFGKGSQSVTMMRCSNPDRIQELLHRAINALGEIPEVRSQGVGLKEAPGLDGFEQLTAQFFGMAGIQPVIGFRDGWMVMGTHAAAVETMFANQAGEGDSWSDSDRFKQFGMEITGPVSSMSYTNTGENIRNLSQGLQQAGMFAPMLIGMAQGQNSNGKGPDLKVIQEVLGLLPSVARIIGKFDFIDATTSACQPGSEAETYVRQSVTLIMPPKPEKPSAASTAKPAKSSEKKADDK